MSSLVHKSCYTFLCAICKRYVLFSKLFARSFVIISFGKQEHINLYSWYPEVNKVTARYLSPADTALNFSNKENLYSYVYCTSKLPVTQKHFQPSSVFKRTKGKFGLWTVSVWIGDMHIEIYNLPITDYRTWRAGRLNIKRQIMDFILDSIITFF